MLGLMPSCITMSVAEPREVSHTFHRKHLPSDEKPYMGSLSAPHGTPAGHLSHYSMDYTSLVSLDGSALVN